MKTLEQLISEAASTGRLGGLTLWRSGSRWQANVKRSDTDGWTVSHHDDPLAALQTALELAFPAAVSAMTADAGDIFG